jgi:hypothetical protein
MGDDQIIALLTEIRDLQKQHMARYNDALEKQQAAIKLQKSAVLWQRIAVTAFLLIVIGVIVAVVLSK